MKHILLIATGGTIASGKTENGLAPAMTPEQLLSYLPELPALCHVTPISLLNLDSTNIAPEHWLLLSKTIEENYGKYDGFVICHGTDTLAYTAAALSYLIQHTAKPIVLTGAQRPMEAENTDAKTNLMDAFRYACSGDSGVCIVFGSHVIAGTRARKMRTKSYNAFTSINFPDLANVREERVIRYIPFQDKESPVFYHTLNTNVILLKLIPGLPQGFLLQASQNADGIILESYGVGGIPDRYLPELEQLISQGKTVIMATQVPQEGSDLSVYQVGHVLKHRYRLLESYDMTLESTVTKLMWAMGQAKDPETLRKLFCTTVNYDLLY
jgi:L-asparaginase